MKIVEGMVQRTPEWHAFRDGGIGGSEIAAVMNISPYKTPLQLFLEKTGAIAPADLSKNPHVRRGIRFEDHIADIVMRHFGVRGLPLCGIHEEYEFLRVSFDLLADAALYEIKAISDKQWEEMLVNGAHPHYIVQVEYQLLVAEKLVSKGNLVYWRQVANPDGSMREEVRVFPIVLTPDRRAELIEAAKGFWDMVTNGILPPADPKRDVLSEAEMEEEQLETWRKIAARSKARERLYKRLKRVVERLDKGSEADEKVLLAIIADRFSGSGSGIRYTRFWKSGTVDFGKALKALAPTHTESDLDPFRKKGQWQTRLTVEKAKEAKAEKPKAPAVAIKKAA